MLHLKQQVLAVLVLLFGIAQMHAQTFEQAVSRRLSAKDGLSGNFVYDIVHDKQGFVWFATNSGLSRYDGYSFLNYNILNGCDGLKPVQALLGRLYYDNGNDLLWITTTDSHTVCYNLQKARFVDYTGKGDYLRCYAHAVHDGGDLWLYDSKQGVRHVHCEAGQMVCTDYTVQGGYGFANDVDKLVIDQAHNAWATTKHGLYCIDSQQPKLKQKANFTAAQRIGDKTAFLTHDGMLCLFDVRGNLVRRGRVSRSEGLRQKITASVGWNGRWVLFTSTAVYEIDINTLKVSHPDDLQMKGGRHLDSQRGTDFVADKYGNMVVFSPQGLRRRVNLVEGVRDHGNRHRKYNIHAVGDNRFLIATYGNGAFIYDIQRGVLEHTTASDGKGLLDSNFLTGALMDHFGNMWFCQDGGGVVCVSKAFNTFMRYLYPAIGVQEGGNDNAVLRVLNGSSGSVALMCKNKAVYDFATSSMSIGNRRDLTYVCYSALLDSHGHYWQGTRGDGLFVDGQLCREQGKDGDKTINDVFSIVEDKLGRIWIASIRAWSNGGLIQTRYNGGKPLVVKRFLNNETATSNLHYLCLDNSGRLWMATGGGLCMVDTRLKNITEKNFRVFNMENGKLPYNELRTIRICHNGDIWLGGLGTGLLRCRYDAAKDRLAYQQYTTANGLGSDNVQSINEDPAGNIWVGTESGLARMDVRTGRIDNYMLNNDVQGNSYQENSTMKLSNGLLLFGTGNGLVVVDPYKASNARVVAAMEPTLTDVLVDGVSIYKMDGMDGSPTTMERLSLASGQNSITFQFSTFEFAAENSSAYQYYLEGVDKGWSTATNRNSVGYNGLPPGDYTFHVRSIGHGSQWSKERTLRVHIAAPWYNMWYSWLAYVLVTGVVAYRVFRNRKEKFLLHQRMKMEKQVNDMRINFFTHVTHEFRTPLAIIQSAVGKIVDEKTGAVSRSSMQTAVRGAKRLSRLINQLMEFRKISSNGLRLQVLAGVDIIGFVRGIYQDFWYAAKQKDITISFKTFEKRYEMTCDRHIVETVVYNLLSNAVKYTPDKGFVEVAIKGDAEDGELSISVSDSGSGISEEQRQRLFQPFMHGYVSQGGMGIGLYVARMMAEKHHGSLQYRRSERLGGASFVFTIPLSDDCYAVDEYLDTMAVADNHTADGEEQQVEDIKEMLPKSLNDVTVAVIEDDPDMQDQIRSELAGYFNVRTYSKGKQGLEGVLADRPSLLVCDVMLPDMNGYDIVKQIKQRPDGYVLPVVMLTALNDEKHQIKGYEAGADDYMVKPCNFRLLVARIIQLIVWSNRLPKTDAPGNAPSKAAEAPQPVVTDKVVNKNLLERFQAIVAQHLAEPDFTIDTLAGMMHMGRTKLYGKIKELTGETPNKYIMRLRMKRAAELLETGEHTVSEVCYKVGLEDMSYFNKCFKSFYGVSPSKYGK